MRRPISPRSASTKPAMSVAISPSCSIAGNSWPAFCCHQLGPAAVELPMIAFAKAGIAGPGAERWIKALVPEPHLIVYRQTPRGNATTGLGAFLPVVHVVLLKGAGRAEAANPGEAERFLDIARRSLVDKQI